MKNSFTITGGIKKQGTSIIQGAGIDLSKAYIRLKEGESVRVRILTNEDIVEYISHGSSALGIYNTPCLGALAMECPLCVASKEGGEEWNKELYTKSRYKFAMADLDSGELRLFDATRGQARGLMETIAEYDEDDLAETAFVFKRTGTGKNTTYSLNAMTQRKFTEVEEAFHKFDDIVADIAFYEDRLSPRDASYLVHLLEEAKFPIEQYFDAELVSKSRNI